MRRYPPLSPRNARGWPVRDRAAQARFRRAVLDASDGQCAYVDRLTGERCPVTGDEHLIAHTASAATTTRPRASLSAKPTTVLSIVMPDSPFTDDQLEQLRDNPQPRCSGCGCIPQLENDGITHWWHEVGCPVLRRIDEQIGEQP